MESTFQKIGIIKYDAFNQMGGKLSFSLALLDENNNGFVLNSVHSADGCYSYTKEIINGECAISLGEEEKELVNAAVAEDFAHVHKIIDESKELRERIEVRKQLEGVLPFISVSEFAKRYFGKSASWLHQRINGNAVHGKVATFTPTELTTLANALKDVAGKLTHAASAFV